MLDLDEITEEGLEFVSLLHQGLSEERIALSRI